MKALVACFCLLVVLSVTGITGCKPKQYPVIVPLVLLAPATITPTNSILHLGDTLWVTANFSDSLLDLNSGHRYRVRPQDLTLSTFIAVHKLQGPGQPNIGIASTLRVIEKVGKLSIGGATTGVFSPVYDGHFYRARFGLIPTQSGIISISLLLSPIDGPRAFGNFIPFIQFPPDVQGQEQKAVLDNMYFVINEGKANNYDLYRQQFTIDPETSGAPDTGLFYGRNSTFTVEVK